MAIKSFGLAFSLVLGGMTITASAQEGDAASGNTVSSLLVSDQLDLASASKLFNNNCSACHGKKAQGVASYPRLSGQSAEYLADKLQTYRAGERVGPNSVLMIQNARGLSDNEIASLSVYISTTFE